MTGGLAGIGPFSTVEVTGAIGTSEPVPTAPGANGPTGWPQHPVAESLYETCVIAEPGAVTSEHADGSSVVECLHSYSPQREAQEVGGSIPPLRLHVEIPVTEEMWEAGCQAYGTSTSDFSVAEIYRAMAAVAPRGNGPGVAVEHYALKQHELNRMIADRDAWSARCAALMTELDKIAVVSAELSLISVRMRKRAETAEARLAERDASLHRAVGR